MCVVSLTEHCNMFEWYHKAIFLCESVKTGLLKINTILICAHKQFMYDVIIKLIKLVHNNVPLRYYQEYVCVRIMYNKDRREIFRSIERTAPCKMFLRSHMLKIQKLLTNESIRFKWLI